jgi:protocatechuate 3,4-dioxygenase beta subunit
MESTGIGGGTMGWSSADGNFSLSSLLPGQYRITARSSDSALWATTEVTLAGQDATGLLLALGPSMTLTGRVAFDATTLTVPADLSTVRVSLVPVGGGLTASRMAADGTFKVASISPGHYRFQASVPGVAGAASDGPRWTVKSVMVKGHDAADAPLDVRPNESVSDVIVTFTDRAADLSGTLRDAAGQPMSGYYIAAFSTDSVFWVQGARRLPPPARSGTTGAFRFVGLPPGEYYLAALIQIDQADLSDAAFLRQLMAVAVRVNLGEGEKKVQDLTLRK